ncbi:lactonase family protein [Spirochaeta isovalerica]|uniref:6-phosphogluconolactonase n=1 Tax=Spirochaeta isovalerica TaxID=150 RepID=A0A841RC55_9SPIO|nr:lactonase family protein [Spirochaeta isovalerica]MBB6481565.1 6-phosphogluconolactonase [Spirochaeta isovalerica]
MSEMKLAVGTYTMCAGHVPDARGKGVEILSFDEVTGSFSELYTMGEMKNPTYLSWNGNTSSLYAIEEDPENVGMIRQFIREKDGSFGKGISLRGQCGALCHISVNHSGDSLYASSYQNGSICGFHLNRDSEPEEWGRISYEGKGPDPLRQEAPHAHQILLDPEETRAYICDLGTDRVHIHSLERGLKGEDGCLELPAGYGPRHMVFDPSGAYAFILCELKAQLILARRNRKDGTLKIVEDIALPAESFSGTPAPAAIKMHPSGHTLALSNRFIDRIEVYGLVREEDRLTLQWIDGFSSEGKTPRDITFSPSGDWLFIANQDSHNIAAKRFDGKTGIPESSRPVSYETGSPVCIVPLL